MLRNALAMTHVVDERIKGLMRGLAHNSSHWFEELQGEFFKMDEAELNNYVELVMHWIATETKIGTLLNPKKLEKVLRGFFKLVTMIVVGNTPESCKKMTKSVGRYLRYTWTSLSQDVKQLLCYVSISSYEVKELFILAIKKD
jgi:hypothetical protein